MKMTTAPMLTHFGSLTLVVNLHIAFLATEVRDDLFRETAYDFQTIVNHTESRLMNLGSWMQPS